MKSTQQVKPLPILAALLLPLTMLGLLTSPGPATAAFSYAVDGLTPATAAGSCWEIRQRNSRAPSGIYWLVTPALQGPEQFYCDQSTNGGGWVLIGRGREAWKINYAGVRTPADVRNVINGPAAFQPAQLPSKMIDGLLNNGRVDSLSDGVRLRRALNTSGSSWQESTFQFRNRDRWTWTANAEHQLRWWRIDRSSSNSGQIFSFGSDNSYRRVDTQVTSAQDFLWGWAYGSNVGGSSSSSSYLWSARSGAGNARPFTQVFLRPQLTREAMFSTIPDSGTPAVAQRSLPKSDAEPTVWGVSGSGNGLNNELNVEAQTFAQVGSTVFVGGNFAQVQRDANGSGAVNQRYLAGFDVTTGEFLPSFRPTFNGQVKALESLPDGRLAVGGEFTTVNGVDQPGLALLDPVTGQLSGTQTRVENRIAGGVMAVRGLDVGHGYLYVAGSFTHLTQPNWQPFTWNAGRIDLATGLPDDQWNPLFNGATVGVNVAEAGDRAYFAGYFRSASNVTQESAAAFGTGRPATMLPWTVRLSDRSEGKLWQFDVQEAAGRVYQGGSQHMLFGYDRQDFSLRSGSITKSGGDFQTLSAHGDNLFAGCHCGDYSYQDAYTWINIGTNWTQADSIGTVGAWEASTGRRLPEFDPIVRTRAGSGAWGLFTDSRGVLWAGGDYTQSIRSGFVNQWSGGFIRFAPRDSRAPSTPGSGRWTTAPDGSLRLLWSPSTDDSGISHYEVLDETRVVASVAGTSFDFPARSTSSRFFIRAVDFSGNRSASTPVIRYEPGQPPSVEQAIATGTTWRWRYEASAPAAEWNQLNFDDSSWRQGNGTLGFGSPGLGTDIAVGIPAPRPLAAQFRRSFTVSNLPGVNSAELSLVVDDGAVVYLNGVELARFNLPPGAVSWSTYATAAPEATDARLNPVAITIPTSALRDGQNVLAVQTHLNYRSSPNASFEASLTLNR